MISVLYVSTATLPSPKQFLLFHESKCESHQSTDIKQDKREERPKASGPMRRGKI